METGELALRGLAALGLLVYGTAHGALVVWVWRHRERLLIPVLLFVSPVGVTAGVVGAWPFIGLTAALTVLAALAVGFLPVALLIGWCWLRDEAGDDEGGLL